MVQIAGDDLTIRHPIADLLDKRRLRVLGVNSGTSMDGLDGALVEITRGPSRRMYRVTRTFSRAFSGKLESRLRRLAASETISKRELSETHFMLGQFIAETARIWTGRISPIGPMIIASHGQTIAHYPAGPTRSTWQIGSLSMVAQKTGCVTIGDFRAADIAAGGMGAPLSGYYHHLLFGPGIPVLNIGGIANVSVSILHRGHIRVVAFDTGPGNMILDAIVQRRLHRPLDRDGRIASRGKPDARIVDTILRHPYFGRRPPKTCGREEFGWHRIGRHFAASRISSTDALATAVELTAWSIADAVRRWIAPHSPGRKLVVTGGGAQNRHLMQRLGDYLGDWKLASAEEWKLPSRYVEPAGFAALAYETLHARAGNLGGGTGANRPAVLGLIALPPLLS